MKTTVLNYDKEILDDPAIRALGFDSVRDYSSRPTDIYSLAEEFADLLMPRQLTPGDTPERISYDLYGTPDYWDILVLLNARDPLWGMFYNDGVILSGADDLVQNYKTNVYSNAPLVDSRSRELQQEFRELLLADNDARAEFLVIKPSKINEFISALRKRGYVK